MRAFNWNFRNFVSLYMSPYFKRNKNATRKQSFLENINLQCIVCFTDNTVLCLCPEATKWSKNVLSLKKSVISLNIYFWARNRNCFECLTIPRKQIQDHSKEFLWNKNNNDEKISWKSYWLQWSLHDRLGVQRPKIGSNWSLTGPYF